MGAYRYIRISRQREEIELQSTDELAFTQLVSALSESACRVRLSRPHSLRSYFHHCRFAGSNEHLARAWRLIAERLSADGWVRLDRSVATSPKNDSLMYFGVPPAKGTPASLLKH